MSNLISVRNQSAYQLRSNDGLLLDFPRGKMWTSFGDRSFSVAVSTLWNALPLRNSKTVRQFTSFKTYLCKLDLILSILIFFLFHKSFRIHDAMRL